MSTLTVCLTHYNRAGLLGATLESLARQTRPPDEVIVRDDASPADPTRIVEQFRGRFPRLLYRRNPANVGMPANLNLAVAEAKGELVANLHDADLFHPELLARWERALRSHPRAGLAFCGYDLSRDNPGGDPDLVLDLPEVTAGGEFFERWFVGTTSCPIWGTVMVRRSVYERFGPFDPAFRNWADVDMWMKICRHYDIAYVRQALISLDNSRTAERAFSWYRILLTQDMFFRGIRRHFADNPGRREAALRRQRRALRTFYIRLMLGGVRHGDWGRLREGWRLVGRIVRADPFAQKGGLAAGLAHPRVTGQGVAA